ncbi:PREDICTED: sialic acid-binding Ig-like lectin 15 [Dipodomys ordii]|uniref:Sialic acid-binding Ig-like lectin 15 n=1 Tax=Dipodomys ordii TaxID=10020 RepID=A0A1S3F0U0_DIPOR|nr:PREDICTED: sialic acid-binding Ig-like lectin 15 [Dipodomys ordii]
MEGSIRLLACLSCVIPTESFVRTKRDTAGDLLNTEVHSAPAQRWSMQVPAELLSYPAHTKSRRRRPLLRWGRGGTAREGEALVQGHAWTGSRAARCPASPPRSLSAQPRGSPLLTPRRASASAGDLRPPPVPAAAPRIVNVSVLPGPAHGLRALCTAEGEPQPVLAWSGPALGNSSVPAPGQGHGYQVTAELSALTHDGRYTCTAANSLGRAEASVYLFRLRGATGAWATALLLGALGLKALLLLGLLVSRATRRHPEHSVTQDTPSRPQAQESSYENLSQMNPRSPTAAIYSPRPSTSICGP